MKLHQLWRIALWLSIFQLSVFLVFWLELVFPSLEIVFWISLACKTGALRAKRFTLVSRSPRLAHKAPVRQARIRLTASVWTVLLLPLCGQARPWFWFSKRTSSVAGLALCLVAFSRAITCSLLWRERYSRPFHWALTSSINTRVVDRTAIEPNRRVKSVGSWKSVVGNRKSEVRNQKYGVRTLSSLKSEVWCMKS